MIISFHKGFILTRSLLKAFREYFSNKEFNQKICNQERTPNISANPITLTKDERPGESEFESDVGLRFFPPVYVQRYLAVQDILSDDKWEGKIKKVIDFGCAEFGFFTYVKHISGVEHILTVDIDEKLLNNHRCRIAPLTSDYLSSRSSPFKVQAFVGSIAKPDHCLLGADAVVCIEIIEHLWPEEVESVPYTVFGFIKPKVAVFTTPNSDFNVLFPNFSGFRHFDHKFEWSREQFKCWAFNIATRYPDYDVIIDGIGRGPPGTEDYGHCSQMAVFVKHSPTTNKSSESVLTDQPDDMAFKLLFEYEYPFREDKRTDKEKICHEAEYYIRMHGTTETFCNDEGVIEIPLSLLMPHIAQWCNSQEMLMGILRENGWEMSREDTESPAVVYPWYDGHSDTLSTDEQDQANGTSDTILANDAVEICPYEDWGLEENVATSSCQSLPNDLDITTNTLSAISQEICVCNLEDHASPVLNINDSNNSIESDLSKPINLYGANSIKLPITEEIISTKVDLIPDYFLNDSQVFQTKEKSNGIETLVQTYPNGESAGLTLNGQALSWKHVSGEEPVDSDDHETPSVSGEWGMSSPELVSCASMVSQDGTASFRSAISHDTSDAESDQEMDLSVEREAAESDDSDGSQGAPIDNPRRIQQHRGHFPFGLHAVVENGDVANNNRDGEGNNAIAFGGEEEDGHFQLFEEQAGDHEVADGFEVEDEFEAGFEVMLPINADPFPPWLLQLLNLTNEEMGAAGEPQCFVNDGLE